jgi:hypothetical protein
MKNVTRLLQSSAWYFCLSFLVLGGGGAWVEEIGSASAATTGRGRVKVVTLPDPVDSTKTYKLLVAENGAPLRGETPRMFVEDTLQTNPQATDCKYWANLRNVGKMNAVRVLIYREPQGYSSGCEFGCTTPDLYSASDADTNKDGVLNAQDSGKAQWDELMNKTKAALDAWVNAAAAYGFYLIVDYHPVGGYDALDAREWWKVIAPRYKDRTHVIYELINEPAKWSSGEYTTPVRNFHTELFTLVRGLAPNTHIILWSFPKTKTEVSGGTTMLEVVQATAGISYQNASVSFHSYGWHATNTNNLKRQYPVINTEIGGHVASEYETSIGRMKTVGVDSWILLDGLEKGVKVSWAADPLLAPKLNCAHTFLPLITR